MKFFGKGDFGYTYEESGQFRDIWVSDTAAQQPIKDIVLGLKVWIHMTRLGEGNPCKGVESIDFWATLIASEEGDELILVKNKLFPEKGGVFLRVDPNKAQLNSIRRTIGAGKKKWWKLW